MTNDKKPIANKMIKKKSLIKPKSSAKKASFLIKLLVPLFGMGVVSVAIFGVVVAVTYPKLPSMDELRNYQPKLPLEVYSADKVLLGQFGTEHRIFITYNQTPKMLVNAILSAEDERFFRHGGVDYIGIVRAAIGNLVSGHMQSGASTITMQVARNFFLSSTKSLSRKFNEVLLAYKIEKSLSKEQILELYVNQIFLGHHAYGFAEAALTYFGKPLDKLNIAEYAVLAGLPKAPSAYNPIVNKKRSRLRELYVLRRMKQLDFITEAQYDDSINQKINLIKGSGHDATDFGGYVSEMIRQILYAKYGESIYTHGYKIYTTIDSKLQEAGYTELRKGLLQYERAKGYIGAEKQINIENLLVNGEIPDNTAVSIFEGIPDYGDLLAAIVINTDKKIIKVKIRNGNDIELTGEDIVFVRKYLDSGGNK
jgi:penicillin-binding protein 1A